MTCQTHLTAPSLPLSDFANELAKAGLILTGQPVISDNIIRVSTVDDCNGETSGWYILHEIENGLIYGYYGDWRTDEGGRWCNKNTNNLAPAQKDKIRAFRDRVKAERDREQAAAWAAAASRAAAIWDNGKNVLTHPYLIKKGVQAKARISTDPSHYKGWLMVPLTGPDGIFSTIQFINDNGEKRFLSGGKKKGSYYLTDGDQTTIYITEGYATALTIAEASECACAVACDAGNLQAVAKVIREEYPYSKVIISGDNDHERTNKRTGEIPNVGKKKAIAAATSIGAAVTLPDCQKGETDFNDVAASRGIEEVKKQLENITGGPEEPLPLRPAPTPPMTYPLDALGPVMSDMALAITDRIRVPAAIAAQSVLSYASLAIQPHYDVAMLQGGTRPTSLFFMSILQSGGRKSSSDSVAAEAMNDTEKAAREFYPDLIQSYKNDLAIWQKEYGEILKAKGNDKRLELQTLGTEPVPPMSPNLVVSEPTAQALQKALGHSRPSMGLFSDEGGQFIGGYSNQKENQLTTAAILSSLWDGGPIRRTRVSEGNEVHFGRRLCCHLMVQNEISDIMLGNNQFKNQGLLSRFLCTQPDSLIGSRKFYEVGNQYNLTQPYNGILKQLFERELPINSKNDWTLKPEILQPAPEARKILISFYNEIEGRQAKGKDLANITDFAGKLIEHATRLAGVIQAMENVKGCVNDQTISPDNIERGITLARYYLSETIRIRTAGGTPTIRQAEELLEWLKLNGQQDIYLRHIMQYGPNSMRQKSDLLPIIKTLEEHGYLSPYENPVIVEGKTRREVWKFREG